MKTENKNITIGIKIVGALIFGMIHDPIPHAHWGELK